MDAELLSVATDALSEGTWVFEGWCSCTREEIAHAVVEHLEKNGYVIIPKSHTVCRWCGGLVAAGDPWSCPVKGLRCRSVSI